MSDPTASQSHRDSWREILLQRLLFATSPVVVAAVVMAIAGSTGNNQLFFLLILPAVALMLLATFMRGWSYELRGWSAIAPLWLGAVLAYFLTGFKGNGSVVGACAVVLTGLLFGRRAMAVVLGSLVLVVVLVAVAVLARALDLESKADLSSLRPLPWVRTTFVASATWTLLGLAITFVLERIEGELAKTRRALAELRVEQERRAQAEAERRAAEESALQAQKMELVGRLAAGAAHDINNLLGVVAGWTDIGLAGDASSEERREAKEALEDSVQHGKALTRQLLALSRRDARVIKQIALERTMGAGVRTLKRLMPGGIELTFEAREPAQVQADEAELQQVLFNLVLNARDALPQSGGKIQITTAVAELTAPREVVAATLAPARYGTLQVKDNGCGIDPSVRDRIFELFFTTKPIGFGTGLGLANVLRIATESSGGIELESAVGQGTTFTLYLPVVAGEERAPV